MFRLVLLAALVYFLLRWLRPGRSPARKERRFGRQGSPPGSPVEEMVQDPVCGTWVPVSQAQSLAAGKETVYFCSAECREKFRQGQAGR